MKWIVASLAATLAGSWEELMAIGTAPREANGKKKNACRESGGYLRRWIPADTLTAAVGSCGA